MFTPGACVVSGGVTMKLRWTTATAVLATSVSLGGCTTIGSGVVTGPPGINKYAFRECLLDNGFYSHQALSGIAAADWRRRHQDPKFAARDLRHPTPEARTLLEESSANFVLRSSKIIANGLMPSLQYWQPGDRRSGTGAAETSGAAAFDDTRGEEDHGRNLPYVLMPAPRDYPEHPQNGIDDFAKGGADRPDWRLNRFLDCYIAPVGAPDALKAATGVPGLSAQNGDDDIEGRLLRAHILLTLLTRFGTQLIVSHPGKKQVTQAELLLGHVAEAEKALRSASLVWNAELRAQAAGTRLLTVDDQAGGHDIDKASTLTLSDGIDDLQPVLRWYGYTTRLLRVFQIGVDIERIDLQQSLDRASNIVAAFSTPIKGAFNAILKDSLAGIATVQEIRIYGDAYLRDARETLSVHRRFTKRDPSAWRYDVRSLRAGWTLWDAELTRSCLVLATVAQKEFKPGDDLCSTGVAPKPAAGGMGGGQ